jgi:hypothetical protein
MSFSDGEKADIRRFCGYPARGTPNSGILGLRYLQAFGQLEYRLNNLTEPEAVVVRRYLGTLTVLESAIPRAADGLDTDQASIWTRNRDEIRDRSRLFDDWRRRLCGFLGIAPGPALADAGISFIV